LATTELEDATATLVSDLEERLDELADDAVQMYGEEIPGYARLSDPAFHADVRAHTLAHYRAIIVSFAEHRSLTAEDILFSRRPGRRRVGVVSLADYLHAFRIGQLVMWQGVRELAVDDISREAALGFVNHMIEAINVASTVAAEVYVETERLLHAEGERVRRDLLEELLAGQPPAPGPRLNAARAAGLEPDRGCLVIAATAHGDPETPRVAASAIVRAARTAVQPLTVVRQDEVVVVVPVSALGSLEELSQRLECSQRKLAERGVCIAIGVSTVQDTLAGVPDAYREACMVRERIGPRGGVVALPTMSAFQYLTDAGDATARRLIPAAIRDFIERDVRDHGGVLTDTLREYVATGLNATLAAKRLHVHVNTARYRLAKIEEETGSNLRHVGHVISLLVAVELVTPSPR
jgi:sugar diacid utilization regulator